MDKLSRKFTEGETLEYTELNELVNKIDELVVSSNDLVLKTNEFDNKLVGEKVENGGEKFNDPANIANGINSHAEGTGVKSYGDSSHAEGHGETPDAIWQANVNNVSGKTFTVTETNPQLTKHCLFNCLSTNYKVDDVSNDGKTFTCDKTIKFSTGVLKLKNLGNGLAFGNYSHVEGNLNIAAGDSSHAEGHATHANKDFSHSEGQNTLADGIASHVEGIATQVNGYASHAEGNGSKSISNYSHAEGFQTLTDCYSHPGTTGNEAGIHAEGYRTSARNEGSHAEGYGLNNFNFIWNEKLNTAYKTSLKLNLNNLSQDDLTAIYKGLTIFKKDDNAILGNIKLIILLSQFIYIELDRSVTPTTNETEYRFNGVVANGFGSHAEGLATVAHGRATHAENIKNTAIGDASHVEGFSTTTKGQFSHAEGQGTITNNPAEHAEGKYNVSNVKNTISSIGVGADNDHRKNAIEVHNDGKIFINGVGGYTGIESIFDGLKSLQDVIKSLGDRITALESK